MSISLKGTVSTPDNQSIAGASVRLSASNQASEEIQVVSWSRTLTNFSGNRWQCWVDNVRDQVQEITWDEFKDQIVAHNPFLQADAFVFKTDKTYTLPENAQPAPAITWTQQLTGFSGNRWRCWATYVRDQMAGIAWEDFREQCLTHNPTLQDDGFIFKADKTYVLPEQQAGTIYSRATRADDFGKLAFDDLPNSGYYDLVIQSSSCQLYQKRLNLQPTPRGFVRVAGNEFRLNDQRLRFFGMNIGKIWSTRTATRRRRSNHTRSD
jgi:hypothetical protein